MHHDDDDDDNDMMIICNNIIIMMMRCNNMAPIKPITYTFLLSFCLKNVTFWKSIVCCIGKMHCNARIFYPVSMMERMGFYVL